MNTVTIIMFAKPWCTILAALSSWATFALSHLYVGYSLKRCKLVKFTSRPESAVAVWSSRGLATSYDRILTWSIQAERSLPLSLFILLLCLNCSYPPLIFESLYQSNHWYQVLLCNFSYIWELTNSCLPMNFWPRVSRRICLSRRPSSALKPTEFL